MWPIKNEHNQEMDPVLQHLIQWAKKQALVRAVLMTSSRTNPSAPVDSLSDYDIVLVMVDIHPFFEDRSWLKDFGEVLVMYWDPLFKDPDYGIERTGSVIQYADGLHVDFNLWPVELLRQIVQSTELPAELDDGYTVLLDKDGLADGMKSPTYRAYIPVKPDNEAFQKAIEDFFSDAPYVAKCLKRDELLPAKWCLDHDMKHKYLRQVLEWRVEIDHDWSVPVGSLGKGLKSRLPARLWDRLEVCYAGAGLTDNWIALAHTLALFRDAAVEVGQHLGYAYPEELHQRVCAYVERIKRLGHRPAIGERAG